MPSFNLLRFSWLLHCHHCTRISPLPLCGQPLRHPVQSMQPPSWPSPSTPGSTTVCSMCGDVGFPDKLFRCARCRSRFQHSYCTNYYGDAAPAEAGVCDWCLSDGIVVGGKKRHQYYSPATSGCSKQQQAAEGGRSEQQQFIRSGGSGFGSKGAAGKVTGGVQEGGRRPRRYKLLKDVMC